MLLAVADDRFLVTAAHVTDICTVRDVALFVPLPTKAPLVSLSGCEVAETLPRGVPPEPRTTDVAAIRQAMLEHRNDDRLDIAAIKLNAAVRRAFEGHFEFVRLSEIEFGAASAGPELLHLLGYPAARTTVDLTSGKAESLPLSFLSAHADPTGLKAWDPQLHLALRYDAAHATDSTGARNGLPPPEGLSGCGIWRVRPVASDDATSEFEVRLLGIEWGVDGTRLRGTKIVVALKAIVDRYPALDRAIDVAFSSTRKSAGNAASWNRTPGG